MSSGSGRSEGCNSGVRRVIVGGLLALTVILGAPAGTQEPDLLPVAEDARGLELQRYRDAVRRHFVLKQYKELLELTEKYGHLYPEDEGTEFYRTQAEIRIEEAEKKIPFARLEDRDFKIPEAPEGAPSLLEELRKSEAELEAASAAPGELGLESAPDDRVAMGTGPLEETLRPPEEGSAIPRRSSTQGGGVAEGSDPGTGRRLPDDIAPAGGAVEEAANASGGGTGPLLMILAVCAVILGVVAALLLFSLMRRGRTKEPLLAGVAAGVEAEGPPAPPLFNFEDEVSQPAPLGDTFGASEMPDPFSETATPEGASPEFASASASSFDEPSTPDYASPAALGETRSGDVNQEISDLLYSPGTASDSVFDALPGRHSDIPAPLGETRADQPALGSTRGDNSDLVQLPDEDSFSLSSGPDADVDALFASASERHGQSSSQGVAPEPASPGSSSAELSSIDIFGDESRAEVNVPVRVSTTRVGLDEIDASIRPGSDSSAEIDSPGATRASAPPDDMIEIPFALEDPFQNLSSKLSDETAFNTSTAEAMAAGSSDAETGADQRELLQIMEEGGTEERPSGSADDLWSNATSGGSMEDSRSQPPATDSAITFQEDETAVIELSDAGSADEPTGMAGPSISEPEAETVARGELAGTGGESQSDAPFDREKLRGREALQLEDWSKAVYHLSIAATLRPEAQDVREDLRRARKMKKEQQTG